MLGATPCWRFLPSPRSRRPTYGRLRPHGACHRRRLHRPRPWPPGRLPGGVRPPRPGHRASSAAADPKGGHRSVPVPRPTCPVPVRGKRSSTAPWARIAGVRRHRPRPGRRLPCVPEAFRRPWRPGRGIRQPWTAARRRAFPSRASDTSWRPRAAPPSSGLVSPRHPETIRSRRAVERLWRWRRCPPRTLVVQADLAGFCRATGTWR